MTFPAYPEVLPLACTATKRRDGVRLFSSGAKFLSFERRDAGACLTLDLRMPGMDGLAVQKLISNQASIPVIFITGRGDVPSTVRAMKSSAVYFLTKPIDETVRTIR